MSPVMVAGVKGFLETSFIDWPGKLAAVVFLRGCNFRCPFCHNGELALGGKGIPDIPLPSVLTRLERLRGWVEGVVVSGGEPTLSPSLPALLEAFQSKGLAVKIDTNGSRPDVLADLVGKGLVQAVAMDIKAPLRPERYSLLAGVDVDLGALRRSIGLLEGSGIPHRFRTTYVPGLLSHDDVKDIAGCLPPSSTLTVQAFDPRRVLDPRLKTLRSPTAREIDLLREMVSAPRAA